MSKIIKTGLYVEGIEVTSEHLGLGLSIIKEDFKYPWRGNKCVITDLTYGTFRVEGYNDSGIRHGCWIYDADEANRLLWETAPSKGVNKINENGGNQMTQINYKADWHMGCPKTKEEWEIFVSIMDHYGVDLLRRDYKNCYDWIVPSEDRLHRCTIIPCKPSKKVSLLEALCLLQRPVKTEQQIKIEELEKTILEAQRQIQEMKEGEN